MPINSRTKGAAFERVICKKINTYLASKGSTNTVKRNLDQYQTKGMADIYWGNLAIECKRYKGNGKSQIFKHDWWNQAVESANDKLIPILIYKYDRKEIMCVIPNYLLNDNAEKNWLRYSMIPLTEVCKSLDEILQKANGSK
jgi:hypothetical protein